MNIGNVSVYVNDLDRAVAFYRDVLGWEVRSDEPIDGKRWVTVAPPGAKTSFALVKNFADWSPAMVGGWSGIVIDVPDAIRAYADLSSRGVEFAEPPRQEGDGWWASFADSEGNLFGLHDSRGRGTPAAKGLMTKFIGA